MAFETHKCNASCRHRKFYGSDQRGNPTPTLTTNRGKFAILGSLTEFNSRARTAIEETGLVRAISRNEYTPIELGVLRLGHVRVDIPVHNSLPFGEDVSWLIPDSDKPSAHEHLVYLECESASDLPRIVDANGLIVFDAIRPWIEDYGPGTDRPDTVSV